MTVYAVIVFEENKMYFSGVYASEYRAKQKASKYPLHYILETELNSSDQSDQLIFDALTLDRHEQLNGKESENS